MNVSKSRSSYSRYWLLLTLLLSVTTFILIGSLDIHHEISRRLVATSTSWVYNLQGEVVYLQPIPRGEWQALVELYRSNGGHQWQWASNDSHIAWNFTAGYETQQHHPCADQWAYIACDCTSAYNSMHSFQESTRLVDGSQQKWRSCSITELHLSAVGLVGALPTSLRYLQNLTSLQLDENALTGSNLATVMNAFPLLEYLSLAGNSLTGSFPLHGTHVNMKKIDLSFNQFTGSIPKDLVLPMLEEFYLEENTIQGSLPVNLFGGCGYLKAFSIASNGFQGSLPSTWLQNCRNLIEFVVSENQFTGTFPVELFYASRLRRLELKDNMFAGSLQVVEDFLATHSNATFHPVQQTLQIFHIDGNRFEGTLSPNYAFWSRNFPLLESLTLSQNRFMGSIPTDLCLLHELEVFDLSNNQLTGSIPLCLTRLTDLTDVSMQGNQLHGKFDCEWLAARSMPSLEKLDVSMNLLTGSIADCNLFHLPDELKLLRLDNNFISGTLPFFLILGESIETVIVREGMFDGFESKQHFLQRWNASSHRNNSLLMSSSLQIISIGENPFHGYFPVDWMSYLPKLEIFDGSSACFFPDDDVEVGMSFHDAMLTFCQHNHQLKTLILDGSNALCINLNSNRLKSSSHIRNHYLSECVFNNFPNLEKLSLSGTGLRGPFPNVTNHLPSTFTTLLLTRNQLSGTIPVTIQLHPWKVLDLSYNKLRGVLISSSNATAMANNLSIASWNLEANRLSDEIPLIYAAEGWKFLSILQGNLFTCALDQSDLPPEDPGTSTYSCGSNSLNVVLVLWLVLNLFLLIYWLFEQKSTKVDVSDWFVKCCNLLQYQFAFGWRWVHNFTSWLCTSSSKVSDCDEKKQPLNAEDANHRLKQVQEMIHIIMNLVTKTIVLLIAVCIPLYVSLGQHFKTHSNTFAFKVSSAYFSGILPAVLCYLTWLIYFVVLLQTYRQLQEVSKKSQRFTKIPPKTSSPQEHVQQHQHTSSITFSTIAMAMITFFICTLLFALIVLLNIAFLYTQIHYILSLRIIFQCIMSISKLLFGRLVIPILFSKLMQYFLSWEHVDSKDERRSFEAFCTYSQTILELTFGVILNVIAPCVATAIYDINCFYNIVIETPNRISISYEVPYCDAQLADVINVASASTSSEDCTFFEFFTDFLPKFQYSYLCTSSLLSNYCFVFVFMVLFDGTINPMLKNMAVNTLQFIASLRQSAHLRNPNHSSTKHNIVLKVQEDNLLTVCINYLAILFTFGITFVPLGILISLHLCLELSQCYHQITDFLENVNSLSFYQLLPKEWFFPIRTSPEVGAMDNEELTLDHVKVQLVRKAVLQLSERKVQHAIVGMKDLFVYVLIPMHLFIIHYFVFDIIGDLTDWPVGSLVACLLLLSCLIILVLVVRLPSSCDGSGENDPERKKAHQQTSKVSPEVVLAKTNEEIQANVEAVDRTSTTLPVLQKNENEDVVSFHAEEEEEDEITNYSFSSRNYFSFKVEPMQDIEVVSVEEAVAEESEVRPASATSSVDAHVSPPNLQPEIIAAKGENLRRNAVMIETTLVAQAAETEEMIATIERYERMYEVGTDVVTILIALLLTS